MNYLEKDFDYQSPDLASIFDELSLWSSYFVQLLFNNIELKRDIKVLDVGCGNGMPLFELAHRLGVSSTVTGIDSWEAAIQRANWKKKTYQIDNVEIVLGDAAKMPFEDASYDRIVSNLGINNFEQPETVIQECFRVLKKGGKLYLTTNLTGHYREFYDAYETVLKNRKRKDLIDKLKDQENHRGSLESVRELLENGGFSITKIVKDRFYWRYLDGSALLNHSLTIYGFLAGWRSILDKSEEKEIFEEIEALLNQIAKDNGELKMTVPMLFVEAIR